MSKQRVRLDADRMSDEGEKLLSFLQERIKGQDDAIKDIVKADEMSRSGLLQPDRPIYAGLFLGPSGVGKTLTAEMLAEYWFGSRSAFTKVSCEAMSEPHGISSLIGSPPGYVGFHSPKDKEGSAPILAQSRIDRHDLRCVKDQEEIKKLLSDLDDQLRKLDKEIDSVARAGFKDPKSHDRLIKLQDEQDSLEKETRKLLLRLRDRQRSYRSIILFDELEKGNETLHNLLLTIIDKGKLTLANGMITDFTRSVIMLTSNVGSKEIASLIGNKKIGFAASAQAGEDEALNDEIYRRAKKAAQDRFRPELLARMDRISVFRPLSSSVIREIMDAELKRFVDEMKGLFKISLIIGDEVCEHILNEALDKPQEGARLLRRKINSNLREPISRLKLRNMLPQPGGKLYISLQDKKVIFSK
ncbi:AAA family ATPase [Patescibacteria group bacterium]|nr:AAA family ATPase [Patescibacteria group bacterium]